MGHLESFHVRRPAAGLEGGLEGQHDCLVLACLPHGAQLPGGGYTERPRQLLIKTASHDHGKVQRRRAIAKLYV